MKGCLYSFVLLLAACLLVLSSPLAAATPAIILQDEGIQALDRDFLYLKDDEGHLTLVDINQLDTASHFIQPQPGQLNQGYSHAVYWLKLDISNASQIQDWFVQARSPFVELSTYRQSPAGLIRISKDPAFQKQPAVSPLLLAPGERAIVFLRLQSPFIVDLHLDLLPRDLLSQRIESARTFVAIIAGCFLATILYNFFLFLSLRDRTYFFYLLFATVNSIINLMAVPFPSDIMSWFGWDWWDWLPLYQPLAPLTTYLFARSFLQTAHHHPRLDKALLLYMLGLILFQCSSLVLPRNEILALQDPYLLLGIFLLLFAGLFSLMQGYAPAIYFLLGIGSFLTGILIYISKSLGALPSNLYTNHAHLAFQAAEMFLMSLALGARIKLLDAAKTRAEVTAEVKSRLLRIISHDMATPLTVVKATAHHMKKAQAEDLHVERIIRATGILEDISRFIRKSETMPQGMDMSLSPIRLQDVFDELSFLFEDKAREKNIQLRFSWDSPELTVMAERISLSNEVLGNLISNAIKFSYPQSVIEIRATLQKPGRVLITIRDQGMGMDQPTVHRLFDPLKKQSRPGTSGERGIGFGMPLAKAYVDAYGGHIEVESIPVEENRPHAGTTVRLFLNAASPASFPQKAAVMKDGASSTPASLNEPR
jgi:signal transduction histidine kinase